MADPRDDPLKDEPFAYRETANGLLQINHRGRVVTTLRGSAARRLSARLARVPRREQQLLLAKATGQFKFGNERAGKNAGKRP